jgi:ubiquinone/menaquinone biosynthesis C-methylase UbiE
LTVDQLEQAVKEMERVGKKSKWCCIESYRNESEKANLLYWQLTCESFFRPDGWKWLFKQWGYQGDCGFIYFP